MRFFLIFSLLFSVSTALSGMRSLPYTYPGGEKDVNFGNEKATILSEPNVMTTKKVRWVQFGLPYFFSKPVGGLSGNTLYLITDPSTSPWNFYGWNLFVQITWVILVSSAITILSTRQKKIRAQRVKG